MERGEAIAVIAVIAVIADIAVIGKGGNPRENPARNRAPRNQERDVKPHPLCQGAPAPKFS
jgi:hypothetical protein